MSRPRRRLATQRCVPDRLRRLQVAAAAAAASRDAWVTISVMGSIVFESIRRRDSIRYARKIEAVGLVFDSVR